jgi:hypothetical protein
MSSNSLYESTLLTRHARLVTAVMFLGAAAMAAITLLMPIPAGNKGVVIVLCAAMTGVHVLRFHHAAGGRETARAAQIYLALQTALGLSIILAHYTGGRNQ